MEVIQQTIQETLSVYKLGVNDLVVAGILLLFIIIGVKKGLIRTLISIAALFVALVGSSLLAQKLTSVVVKIIQPKVTEMIYQKALQGNTVSLERIEGFSSELLEHLGETGKELISAVMADMLEQLVMTILYFASFIILYFVVSMLLKPLNLADKLPIIGGLNSLGGGILGFIQGVIFLYVALWIGTAFNWISEEMIQNSAILSYCTEHSLIELFLKIFK